MWVTGFPGKEKEREDISLCYMFYRNFRVDVNVLINKGVIKRIAFDQYKWTKSKTSLAEYFQWIGSDFSIPGGFWAPVEKVFKVNRQNLSHLASGNGNSLKPDKSKAFKEIKELVERYRDEIRRQEEESEQLMIEQAEQEQKDRESFAAIKTLIDETNGKDIEEIREVLNKIKTVLF